MDSNRFVMLRPPLRTNQVQEAKVDSKVMESTLIAPALLTQAKRKKSSALPPMINTAIKIRHTYRFTSSSTTALVAVTGGTLAGALGGVCSVVNSTIVAWASSLKIHKITVWPGTGTQNTEVQWANTGNYAKDDSFSELIPTGITVDHAIVSVPPRNSLAAFWQASAGYNTTLFNISAPSGSIVDIDISYTLANNLPGTSVAGYAVAALGTIYYGRLDGVGGKFTPVGVPTTN